MRTYSTKELLLAKLNILPTAIYDAFPSVLFGRILVLAVRLGIFESLHHHPQTVQEIASSLKLHPESTDLVLSSLHEAGYVTKQDEHYSLAQQAKKWLVKSSPHYIGNFLAYIELLQNRWASLEYTITNGKPPSTYPKIFSQREWDIYTYGMLDLAKLILPHLLNKLTINAKQTTLLDLCGSHGFYTIALCNRHPSIRATIVDFPQVLTTTQSIICEHQLADRITLQPGDVTSMSFPIEQYDVILAFNIIHGFSNDQNINFIRMIASTLKKGGIVYILDQFKDVTSSGVSRILPFLVGLNLMNEIGGTVYSADDVRRWCNGVGLSTVRYQKLRLPGVGLIRAEKIND